MKKKLSVKEYLKEYRIREALKALLDEGSRDDDALTAFQQILGINWNLFKLHDAAPFFKKYAEAGDPWMQYAWARYNDAVRPSEDSIDIAIDNYQKASDAGIPDATMCLAYLWNEGQFGLVDRDKYDEYLQKAIDEGSDMAILQQSRDAIYGNNGHNSNPQLVYDQISQLISDIGEDLVPQYYTIVGLACEALGRSLEAYTWYEQAFEKGDPKACMYMAILAGGQDDEGYVIRIDDFMKIVAKGVEMGIAGCELYIYYTHVHKNFDKLPQKEQEEYRRETELHFKNAFDLGETDGAFILGDAWYYGNYGFERNLDKAWEWYMKGGMLNNANCLQRLADMIVEGEAPSEYDLDFAYDCELLSLRFGNTDTLVNVVRAYRQGHLQDCAEEIETYYIPEYEERYEEHFESDGNGSDGEEDIVFDDGSDEEMMSRICP